MLTEFQERSIRPDVMTRKTLSLHTQALTDFQQWMGREHNFGLSVALQDDFPLFDYLQQYKATAGLPTKHTSRLP